MAYSRNLTFIPFSGRQCGLGRGTFFPRRRMHASGWTQPRSCLPRGERPASARRSSACPTFPRGVRKITCGEIRRRPEKWSPRQCTDGLTPTAHPDFCDVWVNKIHPIAFTRPAQLCITRGRARPRFPRTMLTAAPRGLSGASPVCLRRQPAITPSGPGASRRCTPSPTRCIRKDS